MSINVTVVASTGVSGIITNSDVVNVSVGTGFQAQVPSLMVVAGDNITVSTASGSFTIIGRDVPVASVNGRTGAVVLTRSDFTAAASTHTHLPSDIVGLTSAFVATAPVQSVQGRTGFVSLTPADITAAAAAHTHATSEIRGLTAALASAALVQSVQGRTGDVVITRTDLTAAASSHSHDATEVTSGVFNVSRIPTHTHSSSDITNLTSVANVISVNGRTGAVSLAAADVTAASSTHGHNYVQSINALTGTPSIIAGSNVTVSTSTSSIVIAAQGGIGGDDAVDGGDYDGEFLYSITITSQPMNQTAAAGAATFTASAISTSGGSVSYQWQRSDDGGVTWTNVAGGTSASLTVSNLTFANDNGDRYRVVVSGGSAISVTSAAATLTVSPAPSRGLYVWGGQSDRQTPQRIGTNQWLFARSAIAARVNGSPSNYIKRSDGPLSAFTLYTSPPQESVDSTIWSDVAVAAAHALGIRPGGAMFSWGSASLAALGTGGSTLPAQATRIGSDLWLAAAAGGDVGAAWSLGIKVGGTLWAWGDNSYGGPIGDGTSISRPTPVQIGSSLWTAISAGSEHSLAIRADGALYAWGSNSSGAVGDGTTTARRSPVAVAAGSQWSSISAGYGHSLGIKSDGTLWAWGDNTYGQLGDGTYNPRTSPVQISAGTWASVSAGYQHSLAINSAGFLFAWGKNADSQIGDGTAIDRLQPTQIGNFKWSSIAAARDHSLAITAE